MVKFSEVLKNRHGPMVPWVELTSRVDFQTSNLQNRLMIGCSSICTFLKTVHTYISRANLFADFSANIFVPLKGQPFFKLGFTKDVCLLRLTRDESDPGMRA